MRQHRHVCAVCLHRLGGIRLRDASGHQEARHPRRQLRDHGDHVLHGQRDQQLRSQLQHRHAAAHDLQIGVPHRQHDPGHHHPEEKVPPQQIFVHRFHLGRHLHLHRHVGKASECGQRGLGRARILHLHALACWHRHVDVCAAHVGADGNFPGDALQQVREAPQGGSFLQPFPASAGFPAPLHGHLRPLRPLQSERSGARSGSPTEYSDHVDLPAGQRHHAVRVHPRRLHPDHRVRLAHRHPGGDPEEVPQPHLLHPVLPEPLHGVALGRHGRGLRRHAALHRGVEERCRWRRWRRRRAGQEEGRVTT
ncbi:UDP-xylose and UDP-N-acetylglucosamine transporter isoform X3 [Festucalex cinctus]